MKLEETPRAIRTPWKWGAALGLLAGFVLGLLDFAVFWYLGVQMKLNQVDVTLHVCLYFAFSFAVLGGLLGQLHFRSKQLQESHEAIERHLEAREESERRAAENEKLAAIGRLAACVAHEVRNPLGVIRTTSSMLLEDVSPDDERFQAGTYIVEEVDRLNAFCTSLLDYARPLHLEQQTSKASELLEQWDVLCQERSRYRNVNWLGPKMTSETKTEVSVDPALITQAFSSLVDNALDEVDEEGTLTLRVSSESHALVVELADDGGGVDPTHASRIFEPFFTTKSSGTGLGLAMAYKVIEAHRGSISVLEGKGAGPDGSGACFQIKLPLLS